MITKQQLRAVMDVLKGVKDRPNLYKMVWQGEYLHATNGYIAVRYKVRESSEKRIALDMDYLTKFYKLMGTKDRLTFEDFKKDGEVAENYPDMENLWAVSGNEGKHHNYFDPKFMELAFRLLSERTVKFEQKGNIIKITGAGEEVMVCGQINRED